eukprot:GHUV01003004.1.p1 GENE.GHUV01003004.1~~GHUV01003004.1.p1  ORF type:complete len:653 (+),score=181.31 GHUV01003004.1:192-2150(+)
MILQKHVAAGLPSLHRSTNSRNMRLQSSRHARPCCMHKPFAMSGTLKPMAHVGPLHSCSTRSSSNAIQTLHASSSSIKYSSPVGSRQPAPLLYPAKQQQAHSRSSSYNSSRLQDSHNSSRSSVRAQAASSDIGRDNDFNFMNAVKRDLGMESNKLDAELRERVERAIVSLGYRVTVGDVAAKAGVKLSEADAALKAIAYDSLGNLEVSDQGEVVYSFDRNFISKIRNRSWLQRLRPLWKRTVNVVNYLARVAFGTALIVSVLLVWLAVVALMSSRDSDNRDSRGYGGSRGFVFIDPTDIIMIWDPSYGRHSRERVQRGEGMTFVEAVFSFVFGDGNPNLNFEERRWRALGAHIQRLGGVLSAEEMAPFLDPPPLGRRIRRGSEKYEDESFVLPALIKFNGEPFVDDEGRLLYKFLELQSTAALPSVRVTAAEAKVPLEKEWAFSEAGPGQQAGAALLGLVNIVGVVTLSSLLLDPIAKLSLYRQGLGFVLGLLPYLQGYAAAFFAIPAIRWFVDSRRNAAIDQRNDNRLEAVSLLQSGDPELAAKSASARKLGNTKVIGRQDIVYTTEKAADEQVNAQDEAEFDRKLGISRRQLPPRTANRVDDVFGRREDRMQRLQREAQDVEVDWGSSGRKQQQQQRRRQDDDWDRLDRW